MLINWKQILTLLFVVLATNIIQAKVADWIANLIRFTRNDLQIYQVVILFSENNKTNVIPNEESIHRIISRKLPTWKISFEETTTRKAEDLSRHRFFKELRATSLFLIIRASNKSEDLSSLYESLEFISNISSTKSRPKCLVVVPEEINYSVADQFLRFCWSKQLLDVSILEFKYTERKIRNSAIMVNFNPFTNTTAKILFRKDCSPKFNWFPDKTRDLRRFEMKVGAFHEPPYSYLTFGKNRTILKATGQDILMTKAIAQAMNFKINWISSKETRWGNINCEKNLTTGLIRAIAFNDINFIGLQGGRTGSCSDINYEWSGNIESYIESYILTLVVPIIPGEYFELSLEWKLTNLGYLTIIFMITWLVGRLLKFDQKSWRVLDIFLIVISMPTANDPKRGVERILFGTVLLSCLLHSSYIFSAFTDVGLQKRPEKELKTLDDVLSSSLQPVTETTTFLERNIDSEGSSLVFLNKTIVSDMSFHDCLTNLVRNRSLVCVVKEAVAQLRTQQDRDEKNDPVMRIVDERFHSGTMAMPLERRSPFVSRFNWILRRIVQAGLFEKWGKKSFNGGQAEPKSGQVMRSELFEEELKARQVIKQSTVVLFCVHSISCIVFICELLVFYIRKLL